MLRLDVEDWGRRGLWSIQVSGGSSTEPVLSVCLSFISASPHRAPRAYAACYRLSSHLLRAATSTDADSRPSSAVRPAERMRDGLVLSCRLSEGKLPAVNVLATTAGRVRCSAVLIGPSASIVTYGILMILFDFNLQRYYIMCLKCVVVRQIMTG